MHSLAVVTWCYLALEARVGHLIEELKDNQILSNNEASAVHFLPTREKWVLLPKLAGKGTAISFDRPPHQVIAQLCSRRNDLLHVRYEHLVERLPSTPRTGEPIYQFVVAMEDMNVVLGRHPEPDRDVLGIALD